MIRELCPSCPSYTSVEDNTSYIFEKSIRNLKFRYDAIILGSKTYFYFHIFISNHLWHYFFLLFEQNFALENYYIYHRKLVKLKTGSFILLKNISKIFRGIFRTLANIYDEVFCKNVQQFYAFNYICKRSPSSMLVWVQNRPAISMKRLQTIRSGSYQLLQ